MLYQPVMLENQHLQLKVWFLLNRDIDQAEPYRVCRRVNILRDYPDDKIKIYP